MHHIAQDNPQAAHKIYDIIRCSVDSLAQQPTQGRPGRVYGTRELVLANYPFIIPYRVLGDEIHILRVFHTSQKLPKAW